MVLGVLAIAATPALLPAQAPSNESGTVKLTYAVEDGLAVALTPARALKGGIDVNIRGDSGEISVCGTAVPINFTLGTKDIGVGLDSNGSGKIEPNEVQKFTNALLGFKVKLGADKDKKEVALAIRNVRVMGKPGAVQMAQAEYFPMGSFKGTLGGMAVRIVDENMDGQITQDGKDAILIGNSSFAQPLLKQHVIGNATYELAVSDKGDSLTFTKVTGLKTGQLDVPLLKSAGVGCLVMADESAGRAYDLVQTRNVPAGTYKLVYGTIGQGPNMLMIRPTDKSLSYTTQEDAINTLKLGPNFHVAFGTTYNEAKKEATVIPMMSVTGAGNEQYSVNFSVARPHVAFTEGTQTIKSGAMEFG